MPVVKTAKLGPFLGENNRLERHALQVPNTGSFLALGQNVDIDNTGRLQSSHGKTKVISLVAGHSIFSNGNYTLFADAGVLYSVTDITTLSTVALDLIVGSKVSYCEINGEVFYSDGITLKRLDANGAVNRVGIPVPATPTATVASGSLKAAWYQYTITYFYGLEEGGAAPSGNIEVPDNSALVVSLVPPPSGVTHIGVYLSGPNGEVPLFAGKYAAGTTAVTLSALASGRQVQNLVAGPMPAGNHLALCLARLLSAAGNVLTYSEPYNYGLTNPTKNYLHFPAEITNVIPCKDGVYVTADKTWWVTNFADPLGDPVLPYGAVAHTGKQFPNENKVFWLSSRGVVVGDALGQVNNIQEENLLLDLSGSGASVFIEGNNRMIVTNG